MILRLTTVTVNAETAQVFVALTLALNSLFFILKNET